MKTKKKNGGKTPAGKKRKCSGCGKAGTGHNVRTCPGK